MPSFVRAFCDKAPSTTKRHPVRGGYVFGGSPRKYDVYDAREGRIREFVVACQEDDRRSTVLEIIQNPEFAQPTLQEITSLAHGERFERDIINGKYLNPGKFIVTHFVYAEVNMPAPLPDLGALGDMPTN